MQAFGVVAIFGALVLLDLRGLLETNNRTKTMVIYFFLIALGLIFSFLLTIGQAPPSPAVIMEKMIRLLIPGKYTVQ
ncbi:MAG: hypothetical protein ABFC94_18380 [Syntrophomonas sp.]